MKKYRLPLVKRFNLIDADPVRLGAIAAGVF